jgi:hypothetical protein
MTQKELHTIAMACGLDMSKLAIPFKHCAFETNGYYHLKVCDKCLHEWTRSLLHWFVGAAELERTSYVIGFNDGAAYACKKIQE